MEVTGAQIREARGLIGWSARQLGEAAGVSLSTVQRFEADERKTMPLVRKAIVGALEAEGVRFKGGMVRKSRASK